MMTEETKALANSPWLWLACSFSVICVLFLAVIYLRRTIRDAEKMGVTNIQVNRAIRSATITSIGPVFVLLSAMLTLILYVGAPLAWARINYIGSASYELQAANFAAEGMDLTLGQSELSPEFLVTASLVMPIGCVGWVIFSLLFSDKMDVVNKAMSGGNEDLVPVLGGGALIGVFSSMTIDQAVPMSYSSFAVIGGALTMFIIESYNDKANRQWLKEWGLTISMIIGVLLAALMENLKVLS